MSSSEITSTWTNCNDAVRGTSPVGGPCRDDIECVQFAYCDTSDAGTCVMLGGQDAACTRTDQCAYKGGPGPLYCNGSTCQPRLANDASCATYDTCESGICANGVRELVRHQRLRARRRTVIHSVWIFHSSAMHGSSPA